MRITKHQTIKHNCRPLRRLMAALGAVALIWLPAALASPSGTHPQAPKNAKQQSRRQAPLTPVVPTANRHEPGKVFLEHADELQLDEARSSEYQVLRGSVVFRKDNMFMYCDSAYFYESTNSLDAFGNVRMEQGDTLFVYGDELNYNGMEEMARLFANPGKKARLINRDVKLESDRFDYDLARNVGSYDLGGTLTDKQNRLTSLEGFYYPSTKDAYFFEDVRLTGPRRGDTLRMYTDSLRYNTDTRTATLLCQTLIVNKDGEIQSSSGTYNTGSGVADLFSRSRVVTRRGNTLTGDTLFYDRARGIGEAFGNMILTDSAKQSTLMGDYGYYNEVTDSAFSTGNALAMEYSQKDTLWVHGDTIIAYREPDSTHITNAFHRVRFFRKDLQGVCDSLSFRERDSILRLYRHPVIWSGARQIHGNQIAVHLNDSTVDWVRLPDYGMMTEHIAEDCYDQLSGSDMSVWLNDTTVQRLYVEGNVQLISFPMENDSSYNKFSYVESSFMDAMFRNNTVDTVVMWPETSGTFTPLYLAKKSAYFLPGFQWYESIRPLAPDEVFDMPEDMITLMSMPEVGGKRRPGRRVDIDAPMTPSLPHRGGNNTSSQPSREFALPGGGATPENEPLTSEPE